MPGSFQFETTDIVRLTPPATGTGLLGTALTVQVTVYNVDNGTVLLSNATCAYRGSGIYSYLWTHGINVKTWCVAAYTVVGALVNTGYVDFFTIGNGNLIAEGEAGKAV